MDLVGVEVQGAGRRGARVQRILGARPHVGAVAVDGAVQAIGSIVAWARNGTRQIGRDHRGRVRRHIRHGTELREDVRVPTRDVVLTSRQAEFVARLVLLGRQACQTGAAGCKRVMVPAS